VDVLRGRIAARGRAIESGITFEYLTLLDALYEEWLRNFDLCPVLTIQSNDLNFAHKPEHVEVVIQKIEEKLAGRDELFLGD
jgi:deoxyadenosine/deoxycytidine kinase